MKACLDAQAPPDSSVQQVRFTSVSKTGSEREILGTVLWKRFSEKTARVLARVTAPEDVRGSAVLLIQRKDGGSDLFSYLPELRKVRRLQTTTLKGNLFGSDFTYEDFQQLQGMADGETVVEGEEMLDQAAVWKVTRTPPAESRSMYERVVSYIEKERCLLLKAEMWEGPERLRKVMTADVERLFDEGGVRIPRSVTLVDQKRGTRTELELLEIDLAKKIKRKELDVTALEK
ncbi:MAG: outer membrane lipoprotein-sorting protein [Myxococcota bacterium]|nr:outer membrane lipoprotein-sorting protein [Myxococcota bacterium]